MCICRPAAAIRTARLFGRIPKGGLPEMGGLLIRHLSRNFRDDRNSSALKFLERSLIRRPSFRTPPF